MKYVVDNFLLTAPGNYTIESLSKEQVIEWIKAGEYENLSNSGPLREYLGEISRLYIPLLKQGANLVNVTKGLAPGDQFLYVSDNGKQSAGGFGGGAFEQLFGGHVGGFPGTRPGPGTNNSEPQFSLLTRNP